MPRHNNVPHGHSTTQLLADYDSTGRLVRAVPVGMEAPADRPISPQRWKSMARDSLRPEPEAEPMQQADAKAGWVRKATGRPPVQNWDQWVWLWLNVRLNLFHFLRG